MKKFFLFAAAAVAALTVNAKVYNFAGIQSTAITVDAQGAVSTYTMDAGTEKEQTIPSVNYTSTVGALMHVSIAGMEGLELQYKNGSETEAKTKNNILKFADDYLQTDGKNVVLVFSGLEFGDEIALLVAAKGSTAAVFAAEGAVADDANPASVAKAASLEEYVTLKFYAEGSEVSIKETAGGYRIISATIGGGEQAIDNVNANVKAQKVFENGQLVIIKNGVRYNALGAAL
ncbi:MAG: hypothetical protein J5902_02430 [Paludibacteraceae bacterium]|nr:hypothetical protein [Paludibacteraceae bacterium]